MFSFKKAKNKDQDNGPFVRKLRKFQRLQHMSRAAMMFGFMTSALGNVLHAEMNPISIIIALLPPTILFLTFEMVSRIPPRRYPWYHIKRWARPVATAGIAGIMVYLSYFHQRDAIFKYTHDEATALLLPGSIDLLMIVGSISLLELNLWIEELEAQIAGTQVKVTKAPERKPEEPPSKKVQVATMWTRYPHLNARQIAEKLGNVTANYAHSVITELRKQQEEKQQPDLVTA